MSTCSNCGTQFNSVRDGLMVTSNGKTVAAVCGLCCAGVAVGKIALRRDSKGFSYEQWLPTEFEGDAA